MSGVRAFTPASGRFGFAGLYDPALRVLTRERAWRSLLLDRLNPSPADVIVDVGCGTGSLAILIKRRCPEAQVIGIDPDPEALSRAAAKAHESGCEIEWRRGFAADVAIISKGTATQAVSSLVFHQVAPADKRSGLAAMFRAVRSGGRIHVADYAKQSGLMRQLFRVIQLLDGAADTQPNADGMLEVLLAEQAGRAVAAHAVVRTPTGAISLFEVETARV